MSENSNRDVGFGATGEIHRLMEQTQRSDWPHIGLSRLFALLEVVPPQPDERLSPERVLARADLLEQELLRADKLPKISPIVAGQLVRGSSLVLLNATTLRGLEIVFRSVRVDGASTRQSSDTALVMSAAVNAAAEQLMIRCWHEWGKGTSSQAIFAPIVGGLWRTAISALRELQSLALVLRCDEPLTREVSALSELDQGIDLMHRVIARASATTSLEASEEICKHLGF